MRAALESCHGRFSSSGKGCNSGKRDKSDGCCKPRAWAGLLPTAPWHRHTGSYSQLPVRSNVSILSPGTGEKSVAIQCKLLDINMKQRPGGKTNKMSVSGLLCPHGTGMQAVSKVAGTWETPSFQQVLPFFFSPPFPLLLFFFFFKKTIPSLQNVLCWPQSDFVVFVCWRLCSSVFLQPHSAHRCTSACCTPSPSQQLGHILNRRGIAPEVDSTCFSCGMVWDCTR